MKNFFAFVLAITVLCNSTLASASGGMRDTMHELARRTYYEDGGCEALRTLLTRTSGTASEYVQEFWDNQTNCNETDGERIAALEAQLTELRQGQRATGEYLVGAVNSLHQGQVEIAEAIDGGGGGYAQASATTSSNGVEYPHIRAYSTLRFRAGRCGDTHGMTIHLEDGEDHVFWTDMGILWPVRQDRSSTRVDLPRDGTVLLPTIDAPFVCVERAYGATIYVLSLRNGYPRDVTVLTASGSRNTYRVTDRYTAHPATVQAKTMLLDHHVR